MFKSLSALSSVVALSVTLAATLLSAGLLGQASAQIPINPDYDLFQSGEKFGEIFVAPGQDTCDYVELWGLFEGYTYPSRGGEVGFEVEPVSARYSSREVFERAFFAAHPKGTLVEVRNTEHSAACR